MAVLYIIIPSNSFLFSIYFVAISILRRQMSVVISGPLTDSLLFSILVTKEVTLTK